ncbi:P-II family nitrogen regulator [Methanosphaera cuniculi]|uniref:Nitrogen regulatory protein P-II n=1 Tax=Methanosphaera cuniculi TaxID=1077256 RepID=A0A2V2BYA9_9EURY|nr:P-II family nitrogen regulator [uncultured Methanosphaera sp.]PWL08937.1 nitrogen regulatory protein P-II [Methanosphaera cuniculi]
MIQKVEAIIRTEKLDIVINNLNEINCNGITVVDVKGHGNQMGLTEKYRGNTYKIDLIPKIKLEIITEDTKVDEIIQVIRDSAYTGAIGDGKIFISEVEEVIRIRTGEKGIDAI